MKIHGNLYIELNSNIIHAGFTGKVMVFFLMDVCDVQQKIQTHLKLGLGIYVNQQVKAAQTDDAISCLAPRFSVL